MTAISGNFRKKQKSPLLRNGGDFFVLEAATGNVFFISLDSYIPFISNKSRMLQSFSRLLKKLSFLACCIAGMSPSVNAQSFRNVDIAPRILDPQQGSNIPSGDPLQLTLSYRNLGPDTLSENDTVRVALFMDNALVWASQNPTNPIPDSFISYESGIRLAPGDSLVKTYPPILFGNTTPNGSHSICIQTYTRGTTLRDPSVSNNRNCATAFFGPMAVNTLDETEILFYPQPVKDLLQWQLPAGKSLQHIALYDLTGRLVFQKSPVPSASSISIANLPSGAYGARIILSDGQQWHRIVQVVHP